MFSLFLCFATCKSSKKYLVGQEKLSFFSTFLRETLRELMKIFTFATLFERINNERFSCDGELRQQSLINNLI